MAQEGPHRIMFMMHGVGTLEELSEVIEGIQDDAEARGLFPDIVMVNAMPVDELDELPEDHPIHEAMKSIDDEEEEVEASAAGS
jgi:hypothetical protein